MHTLFRVVATRAQLTAGGTHMSTVVIVIGRFLKKTCIPMYRPVLEDDMTHTNYFRVQII